MHSVLRPRLPSPLFPPPSSSVTIPLEEVASLLDLIRGSHLTGGEFLSHPTRQRRFNRGLNRCWSNMLRQGPTDILSLTLCEISLFWTACWILGARSILLPSEFRGLAIPGIFEGSGTLTKSSSAVIGANPHQVARVLDVRTSRGQFPIGTSQKVSAAIPLSLISKASEIPFDEGLNQTSELGVSFAGEVITTHACVNPSGESRSLHMPRVHQSLQHTPGPPR